MNNSVVALINTIIFTIGFSIYIYFKVKFDLIETRLDKIEKDTECVLKDKLSNY